MLVGRALRARWPELDVHYLTRIAAGDRDSTSPLTALVDKGAFTADLSEALVSGDADAVVHSWKDLPLEGRPGTELAGTLERADPRDVLLMRRDVAASRPSTLDVLSSSPRRTWLLQQALPELLPWKIDEIRFAPVRGNIQTRLKRLMEGRGHALIVAKAALDRLLEFGAPFEEAARAVRDVLDQCRWMVLPLREVPGAPAQGAVAIETAAGSPLAAYVRAISHQPTWDAVQREREVLAAYGGGCHEALGATVLPREFGRVVSVRGRSSLGREDAGWSLDADGTVPPPAPAASVWPRPEERQQGARRVLDVGEINDDAGYLVARADALPEHWTLAPDRLVWVAGGTTWRRLAARGVWVNGSAEGLGDDVIPPANALAGRQVTWRRLTHRAAADLEAGAVATYEVTERLPADLPSRTHFFWTSGTLFRRAVEQWPEIRDRWHGSGPGRTGRAIRETLGPTPRARIWLDYEDWLRDVTRTSAEPSGPANTAA
jgi:hydroxymethylbilane synthase